MTKENRGALAGVTIGRYAPIIATTLVFTSCIFTPPPDGTDDVPPIDLSSPNGVLNTIEVAYNSHTQSWAIEYYKAALDHGLYVFYFNPNDVGDIVNGYQIPLSWTYNEDWQATRNMFEQAHSISLNIPDIGKPAANATEFGAGNVTISLTVMTDELNAYRADKGYCDFRFKKQTDGTWRLTEWWDRTHD